MYCYVLSFTIGDRDVGFTDVNRSTPIETDADLAEMAADLADCLGLDADTITIFAYEPINHTNDSAGGVGGGW